MIDARRQRVGLGTAFAGLWSATAASNLADGLAVVLLPLMALELTDAPGAVAGITVAATLAWPLFGRPAGWIVDSMDRRYLLVIVNLLRAVMLASVTIAAATGQINLPLLYAAALLLGVGETLADTSLTALIPMVVTSDRRGAANARIETTINVLNQLAGPPLAGALIVVGAAVVTGSTAALYAVALTGLLLVPRRPFMPARPGHEPRPSRRQEISAGMIALWHNPLLRRLTLMTAAMNIVWAIWTALFILYAVAPGPLGLSPARYGALLAAMAVGGILVGPLVDPLTRRLGVRAVLLLDLVGTVLLVAPAAAGLGPLPVTAGLVMAGVGATIWRTVVATVRQNVVQNRLMGRVYAASRVVSWGVLPIGSGAAAAVAEIAGTRVALAMAAMLAVSLVVAFPLSMRGDDPDRAYRGGV